MNELDSLITELHQQKYPEANVIFLAGSVIRGEGTTTSDLDIVVVYNSLPNAYRDSYYFGDWPVEAFIHDPQTLEYFFQKADAPGGVPSLAAMVSEGIILPEVTDLSIHLKQRAKKVLKTGPAAWEAKDLDGSRYHISDLIEDLKDPRSRSEAYAIATQLYGALANHYFRSRGLWSAKGKSIPRRLRKIDASFADRFDEAFDSAFADGDSEKLISLATDLLSGSGGVLFEGYSIQAPKEWRIKP